MKEHEIMEILKRIDRLEKAIFSSEKKKTTVKEKRVLGSDINFSLNERTFVKRYACDKSGPKKLTLLLAYFTKGALDKSIELADIKKLWNKMKTKTLLGTFNMFYTSEAKTKGWIDSKKYGYYNLTNEWKNVL
ncbi:MAG: hypothetical protein PHX78_09560 [bacterium]|nr:hypothetical protein [bacterium]